MTTSHAKRPPLKVVVNHDYIETTPYEFEKKLLETTNNDLFIRNDEGKVTGLDYLKYAHAAAKLLQSLHKENEIA